MNDSNRKKMLAQTFIFRLGIPGDVAAGKAPAGYDQSVFQATYNYIGDRSEQYAQALSNLLRWPKESIDKELAETQRFINSFTNKEKEFLGKKGIFNATKGVEAFSVLNKLDKITRGELQEIESEIERKWFKARRLMGNSVGARNRLLMNYRAARKVNTPPRQTPVRVSPPKPVVTTKHTPLHLSMYNGTLPKSVPAETLDLPRMLSLNGASMFKDKKYGQFTVKVTEITGRSKTRFQKIWQLSSEVQNTNRFMNSSTGSITFKGRVTSGETTVGASLTIHMSGAIRISGGFIDINVNKTNTNTNLDPATAQAMLLKTHVFDSYLTNLRNKPPVVFNNISGNFNIDHSVRMEETAFKAGVMYEPELSPQLKIPLSTGSTMIVSSSGKMQLTGIKGMRSVLPSFREALDKINNDFVMGGGLVNFRNYKPKRITKVARRANNQPAPNITRRGTTCPKESRPVPLSFKGKCQPKMYKGKMSEYYVRANPQGEPCCYRKTANVPNSNSNSNSPKAPPLISIVNGPTGLKLGSRQCMRYTRVRLFEIATLLKVKNLKKTDGKEVICEKIRQKSKELGLNKTKNSIGNSAITITNNNGKVYAITGKGRNLRLGSRVCSTYPKPFLVNLAGRMGLAANVSKMTKVQICEAIEQAKDANRGKRNNQAARNKQERLRIMRARNERLRLQRQRNLLEEQERIRTKLGLGRNVIRSEISKLFGVSFMKKHGNKINLNEQTNLLFQNLNTGVKNGTVKKGARGQILKADVAKFKRNWVIRKRNSIMGKTKTPPPPPAVFNARNDIRKHLGNERFNRIKNSLTSEILQNYSEYIHPNPNANKRNTWIRLRKSFGILPSTPAPVLVGGLNVEEV